MIKLCETFASNWMKFALINPRHKSKGDTRRDEPLERPTYPLTVCSFSSKVRFADWRLVQDTIPRSFDLSDVRAFEKMRLAFAIELTSQ